MQGPVLAVGTSLGVVLIAQLPSIAAAAAAAAATGTAGDAAESRARLPQAGAPAHTAGAAAQQQSPPLLMLGEPRSEAEAVTSVGFSRVESNTDPLWVIVGHASGTVAVWDLQKRPVKCVATISEF